MTDGSLCHSLTWSYRYFHILYFVFTVVDEKYDSSRNAETSFEDNQAHCENEDGSATLPKPSAAVQVCSPHDFPFNEKYPSKKWKCSKL